MVREQVWCRTACTRARRRVAGVPAAIHRCKSLSRHRPRGPPGLSPNPKRRVARSPNTKLNSQQQNALPSCSTEAGGAPESAPPNQHPTGGCRAQHHGGLRTLTHCAVRILLLALSASIATGAPAWLTDLITRIWTEPRQTLRDPTDPL